MARARGDLADIADENQKFKEILSKKCVSKSQNPTINVSFQGLEPLPQILNKLGRNKKLNPQSLLALLVESVSTRWRLCSQLFMTRSDHPGLPPMGSAPSPVGSSRASRAKRAPAQRSSATRSLANASPSMQVPEEIIRKVFVGESIID